MSWSGLPPTLTAALLLGAIAGLGITLVVRELLPRHTDLATATANLRTHRPGPSSAVSVAAADAPRTLTDKLGARLLPLSRRDLPGLQIPAQQLDLLGMTPANYLGQKAVVFLLGLVFPGIVAAILSLAGITVPLPLTPLAGIVLGVGLTFTVDLSLRREAVLARSQFTRAIGAYLELVALARLSNSGPVAALVAAADVADSWPFQRLRQELLRSSLSGVTTWRALTDLADELDVPALAEVAEIMRQAGADGATVYESLRARGRALRTQQLTDEQAKANARSESLDAPVAVTALVFSCLLIGPSLLGLIA